ncbi:fatty acid hydroxylase [Rhizocola hellebori]|uniref:Fatty acid hydroxylase n=2 Tax=Rhizocola hellebori TaxID=1392758 RepID=A0A8J3QIZ4_9ACTN|nr:fatty acid hydroxylase [Rhizocola hellebori]
MGGMTLAQVRNRFIKHASPWILATFLAVAAIARLVVGDWRLSDLLLVPIMLAVFPFFEWVLHVAILHWRPRTIAGITIDPMVARSHRWHHAHPRELDNIFIPWQAFVTLLPAFAAIGLFAFPRLGLGLTFILVAGALGLGYEWTHFLIHTDYRPKTSVYKAVWRNHRLHHYRNEHYWFTVTTTGTADRVLGTYPDPSSVAPSPTAKALHALEV